MERESMQEISICLMYVKTVLMSIWICAKERMHILMHNFSILLKKDFNVGREREREREQREREQDRYFQRNERLV